MRVKCPTDNASGFSMLELLAVIAIIGTLVALAVPRMRQFQAKARMAEGRNLLSHIHTLQQAYFVERATYLAMPLYGRLLDGSTNCTAKPDAAATLGFEISPCPAAGPVPRFGYQVTNATDATFTASALTGTGANNLVCPGDARAVQYDLTEARVLSSPSLATPISSCQ